MKQCEICDTTQGQISGKTGRFGMDLCMKHYVQMGKYGKVTDDTPAVKTMAYKENYPIVEATYKTIEVKVAPQEYKINIDKNFNHRREAAIEIMEMCAGIYRDPRITRMDYTRFIPKLVERGIIEESSPGTYRLTKEYAEPR